MYCSQNMTNISGYVSLRVNFKANTCVKYRREVITSWDRLIGII